MTPVYKYLVDGTIPDDPKEPAVVRRRAFSYVILEDKLYRRGFSIPSSNVSKKPECHTY